MACWACDTVNGARKYVTRIIELKTIPGTSQNEAKKVSVLRGPNAPKT